MKKVIVTVILIFCLVAAVGCTGGDKPTHKDHVVLSFVTGVDGLDYPDIVLNGTDEQFMPEDPIRAGYVFGGWYCDSAFLLPFDVKDGLSEDTTLYAKWIPNGYRPPSDGEIEDKQGLVYKEENVGGSVFYTVTGYKGSDKELVIPTRYNTHPVTKIADGAFKNNINLEKINFGTVIEKVGAEAFRGCFALKEIVVASGSAFFKSEGGILYNSEGNILIVAPAKRTEALTFNKKVASVVDYAFENCSFRVDFPSDSAYKAVKAYDFAGFKGEIKLSGNIKSVEQYAFKGASANIIFGADCEIAEVGLGAFDGYRGEVLHLPVTVKALSAGAFSDCTATVDLSSTGITEIAPQAFQRYAGESLIIPAGVKEIGKNAFYQSTARITFASGSAYTKVKAGSFLSFDGEVVFPSSVAEVETNAFSGAHAKVNFSCKEGEITLAEGYDNNFKGQIIYLIK